MLDGFEILDRPANLGRLDSRQHADATAASTFSRLCAPFSEISLTGMISHLPLPSRQKIQPPRANAPRSTSRCG